MVLFPQIFGSTGYLSGFFAQPQNILYMLAFLVPLILLYLIRPKPINVAVPSLMFILNDMGRSNVRRFFRTLFRDVLFLIQALIIILLGLALAKPFIEVTQESLVQQSIIVIDTSASTRAFNDDRFDQIKTAAIEELSADNILIAARQNPVLLDENDNPHLTRSRAESIIEDLEPMDVDGDLGTALDIAAQYVGPDAKVTIVSDLVFSRLENAEIIEAKLKVLRSKGALVEIRSVASEGKNVGIISAVLSTQNATIEIKIQNFNDKPEEIGLEYNGKPVVLPKNVLEQQGRAGSLLSVSVPIVHGTAELILTPNDDFMVDNHYYISTPAQDTINVLLINNDPQLQQSKLIPALQAAGDGITHINVEYGVPPKIPDLNHQVYIIKDVNTEFVLPGIVKDLRKKAEEGAVIIFFAQSGLFGINTLDLLPVTAKEQATPLTGKIEVIANSSTGLMKGLSDPGQVDGSQLLRVAKTEDAIVHAYVTTNDGPEPVIAHKRIGKGVVLYYGIKDARTTDLDPQSYAVIWGRIIDYSIPDLRLLNVGTGTLISSSTANIITPLGKRPSPVIATRSGIYQAGQTSLAANLYPLQTTRGVVTSDSTTQYESFISSSTNISAEDAANKDGITSEENKVPRDLSTYALLAGMLVMLFEIMFVKFRGDL